MAAGGRLSLSARIGRVMRQRPLPRERVNRIVPLTLINDTGMALGETAQ
jgi:hypothetical protein